MFAGSAVALSLLGLAGCGTAAAEHAGHHEHTSHQAESTQPEHSSHPEGEHHTINITVENGEVVVDSDRITVAVGDRVELKVTSDVSDEVHLHGYDIAEDVDPGTPATISFVADVPGQFDAELEQRHQKILEFEVR
ncbi:hypothetical protein [Nocardioides sp. NPDC006303]|uniref:hypothetical protein n=1 Tax=Nocardioides sp. NPDC006303 TaxID=3156747 RepID=UPI0033A6E3F0